MRYSIARRSLTLTSYSAFVLSFFSASIACAGIEEMKTGYILRGYDLEEIVELPASAFSDFSAGRSLGYLESEVWVRVDFGQIQDITDKQFVIRMLHVDRMSIFRDNAEAIYSGGDTVDSPKSQSIDGYTLQLDESFNQDTLFIRLQSDNATQLEFEISDKDAIVLDNYTAIAINSAVIMTLLLCSLWGLARFIKDRDWLSFWFFLKASGLAVMIFVHSGLARFAFSGETMPNLGDLANLTLVTYISFSQIFECSLLLRLYGIKHVRWLIVIVLAVGLLKLALLASAFTAEALQLNQISVPAILAAIYWLLTRSVHENSRGFLFGVRAFYVLQGLPIIGLLLVNILFGNVTVRVLEIVLVCHGLLAAAFIVVLLSLRSREEQEEKNLQKIRSRELELSASIEAQKAAETADLVYMLAHEIGTPLAAMKYASAIGQLSVERVNRCINAMDHVLSQCGQVELIQTGAIGVNLEAVHLEDLIADLVIDFPCEIESKVIKKPSTVLADRSSLRILLSNVLSNAHKHKASNTRVNLFLIDRGENVIELTIENQTRDEREIDVSRLFEKYYRDRSSSGISGTGLGLYIVKRIAEQSNMQVILECKNSVFKVVIRIIRAGSIESKEERVGLLPLNHEGLV